MTRLSRTAVPALSLFAAAMLLAGCVNLAPAYQQPAAPVPAAFPATGLSAPEAQAPASIGWREFFVDARLRRVVELTLANNRDLRVAALNIERARAQYGIARADAWPSVNLGAAASRARTSGTTGSTSTLATQYSVNLGLVSYELDLFGRVRNLGDAALESYFSVDETRRSVQISLVAEVASAWLALEADTQRLKLAQDTLASQKKSFELIERSHALGAQSGLALAQAQTTVDSARLQAATYDSQVEQDRNALALLAGGPLPDELLPTPGTPLSAPVAQLLVPPAGLPSSVLLQRPDVLAAEHVLRASNADIGAARAAFYPRISLTGAAGTASNTLSGLFKSGSSTWSFVPSISLPIFDGGANRANLKVAEVQQQIQLASYEKTLQTAFREVADALAARRTLAERMAAQQSLVAASQRSFDLSQALFRSGGGAYLDTLIAQRALYLAQQDLIDLQRVEQVNRLTLYKVLGGGWSEASNAVPAATAP
ncbi:efflux transporter outer membrane subunit [Polaromonas sp. YR568]|uniref:efflux transporter outer membrane subunit n=1 Tax=Polaromonas sp. YR568 TaxID=1855301 RepID=UPI00398BC21E